MKATGNLVADTICRTAEIGLAITGAADAGPLTIIETTPVAVSGACPDCGQPGKLRDHITRRLVDLPVVGFPTRLHVKVPRFRCTAASCKRKIFQESLTCADDGAKLTDRVTRWILQRLAIDRMSVSATAKALGVGWDLVNQVALDACRQLVYGDPHHLDGVRVLGVDEHVWKHTRKPDLASNLMGILVDLTPLVDGREPARLFDMPPGRSADLLSGWLKKRDPRFREQTQVVTMDGFTGYAIAVEEHLPKRTKSWSLSMRCIWQPTSSPHAGKDSSVRPPDHLVDQDELSHRAAKETLMGLPGNDDQSRFHAESANTHNRANTR